LENKVTEKLFLRDARNKAEDENGTHQVTVGKIKGLKNLNSLLRGWGVGRFQMSQFTPPLD